MGRIKGAERGFFLAALIISLPTTHPTNTAFILKSLTENRADCSIDITANTPDYLFDAVLIPGAGIIRNHDGTLKPSPEGEKRLEAGAFAFSKRLAPNIILLDGKGEWEEESISRKYLHQIAPDIPDESILEEHKSINTATNMKEATIIAKEQGFRLVAIITSASHLLRATALACTHGLKAFPLSAEELLIEKDPKRTPALEEINSSPRKFAARIKETLEVFEMLWDSKGTIPTLLRKGL